MLRVTAYLRRTTTSGRLIPEIDGLRFVAISSVVVFHLSGFLIGKSALQGPTAKNSWLAMIATTGDCGVSLFSTIRASFWRSLGSARIEGPHCEPIPGAGSPASNLPTC